MIEVACFAARTAEVPAGVFGLQEQLRRRVALCPQRRREIVAFEFLIFPRRLAAAVEAVAA